MRVEPDIGRGTAFQQPVVLQVVSPAEDAEAHIFVFAEGDDGLLFLCAYPFPLRLYEPQRNELRLRLFEVVLRLRRGEGGKDALRVGNFFLLRFPAGQECVERAFLLLIRLEISLRVLRGAEPLVQRDFYRSPVGRIPIFRFQLLHALFYPPEIRREQFALDALLFHVRAGVQPFERVLQFFSLFFEQSADGGFQLPLFVLEGAPALFRGIIGVLRLVQGGHGDSAFHGEGEKVRREPVFPFQTGRGGIGGAEFPDKFPDGAVVGVLV